MMSAINQSSYILLSAVCVLMALPVKSVAAPNAVRQIVTTEHETLSLADLIAGDNIPNTPIFRAPPPGESGTIKVTRILAAARKMSLDINPADGFDEVTISRKSRVVTESDIHAALEREMAQIGDNQKFDFTVIAGDQPIERQIESIAKGRLEIRSLKINPEKTQFQAIAEVSDSAMLLKKPIEVRGTVRLLQLAYIATRDIERGIVIGGSDYRTEYQPLSEVEMSSELDPVSPLGMVLNRNIRSGERIPTAELVAETQVEKNANVLVRYERAGLMISMRGKALQSGSMGDVISVMNPQSKRTLEAIVTGKGRVSVKSDTSTNLAANIQ
ncbi:MAG: flagellar basal body P-ring formation chaperone FlgA [Hyphomicrobiales bacterium]